MKKLSMLFLLFGIVLNQNILTESSNNQTVGDLIEKQEKEKQYKKEDPIGFLETELEKQNESIADSVASGITEAMIFGVLLKFYNAKSNSPTMILLAFLSLKNIFNVWKKIKKKNRLKEELNKYNVSDQTVKS